MKRLFTLIRKQWLTYTIALIALLASIVLDMYNPYFVGEIIDRAIVNGEMDYLKTALLALTVICEGIRL